MFDSAYCGSPNLWCYGFVEKRLAGHLCMQTCTVLEICKLRPQHVNVFVVPSAFGSECFRRICATCVLAERSIRCSAVFFHTIWFVPKFQNEACFDFWNFWCFAFRICSLPGGMFEEKTALDRERLGAQVVRGSMSNETRCANSFATNSNRSFFRMKKRQAETTTSVLA